MIYKQEPLLTVCVLDFKKEYETRICLESIRQHIKVPYYLILLDNGSNENYPWDLYKEGLCDVLISKSFSDGGGFGQTDLIRFSRTKFTLFVQNDQSLLYDIDGDAFKYFTYLLEYLGYHCVDLNGDQSYKGIWTDRAHLINTAFFNSLGPFPNYGPGLDHGKWNEQYLQETFSKNNYKIAHISPNLFQNNGKWSIRTAGDGLYKHRTDTKILFIEKQPTYKTETFPPFDDSDWQLALSGNWPKDGKIPNLWMKDSFTVWND